MVGSNGIWPDGEPHPVRQAYDNQRQFDLAGRRETPMTFEEEVLFMTVEEREQLRQKLQSNLDGLRTVLVNCESIMALGRLCKTYGIK